MEEQKRQQQNNHKASSTAGGLRAVLGCNLKALALFRISLGFLLLLELLLRYRFIHVFYSEEGTFPTRLLIPQIDWIYRVICIHAYSGSMVFQQCLLTIQVILAFCLMVGYKTSLVSVLSWFLYLSLTLRNTWLNFILDRYFHYMLFYSMFLPSGAIWSLDNHASLATNKRDETKSNHTVVSLATMAIKCQIFWIYMDAGYGKYSDPLGGWSLQAYPLPALDTYARHTVAARYLYALLTPTGLRFMTPTVVYVELLACPLTLLGSYLGNRKLVLSCIAVICSLHFGIALTVRNTVLLSSVACAAWCVFLPPTKNDLVMSSSSSEYNGRKNADNHVNGKKQGGHSMLSKVIILSMIFGSFWFEVMSNECNQSMKHVWSTLLHNRWNVFIGAEEYVTWEIAPGRLADGSVVDVWGQKDQVDWEMPGTGAPCTSTARLGRWRSFPYLAELEGEEGEALWSYLCRQWDRENGVDEGNPGRKLLRYNFFMLQADVLPNMGFSATRKRLIHSHDCTKY
eukprot:CAMPEP_0176483438 /NCGR_PEP_ID=MMETSP0200_2-20121128/3919_1 /TAXON_ID=947934 /ORGANISM="Chaetoceros sp., Strain GSL56" /LENGTH=511 /DNA_ID=CAMNT_0017879841 /DNA_START=44 /DNA_END=1579 /DNA_ORIENTATION=+